MSSDYDSPKLASRLGRQAAPSILRREELASLQSQPQPICRLFIATLRRPISARDRSPSTLTEAFCYAPIFRSTLALRTPPVANLLVPPGSRLLANSDAVAISMEFPDPRQVRPFTPLRPGSTWRVSRDR